LLQRNFFRAFWVAASLVLFAGLLHTEVKAIDSKGPIFVLIIFPIAIGLVATVFNRPSDENVVRLLDNILDTKSLFISALDGLKSDDKQKAEGYELVIRNANHLSEKSIGEVSVGIGNCRPKWTWVPGLMILTGMLLLQFPGTNTLIFRPDWLSDNSAEISLASPLTKINSELNSSSFEEVTSTPENQGVAKSGKNAGEHSGLGKNDNKPNSREIKSSESELSRKHALVVGSDVKSTAAGKPIGNLAIGNSATDGITPPFSGLGDANPVQGLSQSQHIDLKSSFTDIYRKGTDENNSGSFGNLEFDQITPNLEEQLDNAVPDYLSTGETGKVVSYNSFTLSQKKVVRDYYRLLGTK